jgi:hypothetical protein
MRGTPSPVRTLLFTCVLLATAACGGGNGVVVVFPCCNTDGPFCPSFAHGGAWDPGVDWIQDVASSTLGTVESLAANGGKPYYQMRLGCNGIPEAHYLACQLDIVGPLPDSLVREAWCSEAISYWHREAEVPYVRGYGNSRWLWDWRLTSTYGLQLWYETEEANAGRGRWIDWSDWDYANFEPGVNAPVPGAYVLIRGWDAVNGFDGNSHSMMVDEMTVYRTVAGDVTRVEVTILEGNSSNMVTDARTILDVYDVTPWGTQDVNADGRRIRGFGVDLDASGDPIYDPTRLHYVVSNLPVPQQGPPPNVPDLLWEQTYAPLVPVLVSFARNLGPGPVVQSSAPGLAFAGLPDGLGVAWVVPANVDQIAPQGFDIDVDLRTVHPLDVDAVELRWGGALPQGYGLQWAGANQVYQDATVPALTERNVPIGADGLAASGIPIPLGQAPQAVRYLRLRFPPGTFRGRTVLHELRLLHDWGPAVESEDP